MPLYRDETWLRNEIENKGRSYKEISEQFGVGYTTIANRAKSFGIKLKTGTNRPEKFKDNTLLKDREWLEDQYITQDKRIIDIAKEFSLAKTSITRWIGYHGLSKSYEQAFKRKRKFEDACTECGKPFIVRPSLREIGQGMFCNRTCSAIHQYKKGKKEKLRKGHQEFSESEVGKRFFIERGKATTMMLSKGRKTSIETKVENELSERGVEFSSQKQYELGIADVFIEPNIYVFCDGDYWHAYKAVKGLEEPTEKQRHQIAKDARQTSYLKESGNKVYRFWEHEINKDVESCIDTVMAEIDMVDAL